MHRKVRLCHTFRRKVWEMSILLSRVQFGSHIYSSVPEWVWSAPVYVRAILIHKPTILNSSKPAEVRVAGWCLSERARSTPDLTEKTPESHSRLPMLNRNLPLIYIYVQNAILFTDFLMRHIGFLC